MFSRGGVGGDAVGVFAVTETVFVEETGGVADVAPTALAGITLIAYPGGLAGIALTDLAYPIGRNFVGGLGLMALIDVVYPVGVLHVGAVANIALTDAAYIVSLTRVGGIATVTLTDVASLAFHLLGLGARERLFVVPRDFRTMVARPDPRVFTVAPVVLVDERLVVPPQDRRFVVPSRRSFLDRFDGRSFP